MSKVQDFFGAAPKTVLNKPFMHVQDQKPTYTESGTAVIGWNNRDLNTVVVNEIPGASLNASTGQITLAAGKYYVEVTATQYDTDRSRVGLFTGGSSAGTQLVLSPGEYFYNGDANSGSPSASGQFTLAETTNDIVVASAAESLVSTNGFGIYSVRGPYSIFCDIKIWQLDATISTPVLVNDKLYPLPGSTIVTGNMHGLDYEKTGDNEVTVQPGICIDSTNTTILSASSSQVVIIGSVINTIYNLFLCNDGIVRTDTDVSGANLSAYSSIRWIGFVLTSASGGIKSFVQSGDRLTFNVDPTVVSAPTSGATYSVAAFAPASRIKEWGLKATCTAASGYIYLKRDSVDLVKGSAAGEYSIAVVNLVLPDATFYQTNNSSAIAVFLSSVTLKR